MAKQVRFSRRDIITAIVIVVIICSAIAYYFYNKDRFERQQQIQYTKIDEVFTETVVAAESDIMKIHFIDVGQGDCIFVEFPDGKNMLIDSGKAGNDEVIIGYLDGLNIDSITLVLATHKDADHIGSMPEIFERYEIDFCMRPFVYYDGSNKAEFSDAFNMQSEASKVDNCATKTYYEFLKSVQAESCAYEFFNKDTDFSQLISVNRHSQQKELKYSVDFLTPTAPIPKIGYSDANDYSPIMVLEYCGFSLMLTGDAHANVEEELLYYYDDEDVPDVDVLKAGHHGSSSSSSEQFINAVKPEIAVISCGTGNSYGHPHAEVLDRFIDGGILVYRTDLQGNIVIEVDMEGEYSFSTQKQAQPSDLYAPGV